MACRSPWIALTPGARLRARFSSDSARRVRTEGARRSWPKLFAAPPVSASSPALNDGTLPFVWKSCPARCKCAAKNLIHSWTLPRGTRLATIAPQCAMLGKMPNRFRENLLNVQKLNQPLPRAYKKCGDFLLNRRESSRRRCRACAPRIRPFFGCKPGTLTSMEGKTSGIAV